MSLGPCSLEQLRRNHSKLAGLLQNTSCTRCAHRGPGRSYGSPGKHHTSPGGSCCFPGQGWGLFSAALRVQTPPGCCSCLNCSFLGLLTPLWVTVRPQPGAVQELQPRRARRAGSEVHPRLWELVTAAVPRHHCDLLCSCLSQTGICLARPALAVQCQVPPATVWPSAVPGAPSEHQDLSCPPRQG